MLEQLKKALHSFLGAVAMSSEELKAAVDRLVADGTLTPEEGQKLFRALLEHRFKDQDDLAGRIDRELRRLVELSPLVSRAEFRKLEERVKRLESLLTPGPEAPPAGAPPPPGDG